MSAMRIVLTILCSFSGVLNVEATTVKMAASAQMKVEAELVQTNPVRKVVKLLEQMKAQREAEQAEDKKTYDAYICKCIQQGVKIEHEIEEFKDKEAELDSEIDGLNADKEHDKTEMEKLRERFNLDKADIEKMELMNAEEEAAYQAQKKELTEYIDALRDAIRQLRKGVSHLPTSERWGGHLDEVYEFFQKSPTASVLRQMMKTYDMEDNEREALTSLLQQGGTYEPTTNEIIGILKQMKDEFDEDLGKLMHENEIRAQLFRLGVKAKMSEEETLKNEVEKYMRRLAEEGILLAESKGYHSDVYDALLTDEEWLRRAHVRCHNWRDDYILRERARRAELSALADTLKILESDHARELMRRTFAKPAESLLQMQQGTGFQMKQRALQLLRQKLPRVGQRHPQSDLVLMALQQTGTINMERIIEKINGLVGVLKLEQKEDDEKKVWCGNGLIQAHGEHKIKGEQISQMEAELEVMKQRVTNLNAEMDELYARNNALDKDVAAETKARQEANRDYLAKLASHNSAITLLDMCINRLNKAYNEDEYHASIGFSMAQNKQDPRGSITTPPPIQAADHQSQSAGAIGMLKEIVNDLDLEIQAMKRSETDAQKDYEDYIEDQKKLKEDTVRMITDKQTALGEFEKGTTKYEADLRTAKYEQEDNEKFLKSMEIECEFTLKYYDVRKVARTKEIESLQAAAGVLKGEEFESLIQTQQSVTHLRGATKMA